VTFFDLCDFHVVLLVLTSRHVELQRVPYVTPAPPGKASQQCDDKSHGGQFDCIFHGQVGVNGVADEKNR